MRRQLCLEGIAGIVYRRISSYNDPLQSLSTSHLIPLFLESASFHRNATRVTRQRSRGVWKEHTNTSFQLSLATGGVGIRAYQHRKEPYDALPSENLAAFLHVALHLQGSRLVYSGVAELYMRR